MQALICATQLLPDFAYCTDVAMIGMDYCSVQYVPLDISLESYLEATTGPECSSNDTETCLYGISAS